MQTPLPKHLYTAKDVKTVRELLLSEQSFKDALTLLTMPEGKAVLDHDHKTQYVRGVLHRSTNAMLGVIENNFNRHIKSWYPNGLYEFLLACADYVHKNKEEPDERFLHPSWMKKAKTEFNKLDERTKDNLLIKLGLPKGKNGAERKKNFSTGLLSRDVTFKQVQEAIDECLHELQGDV